MPFFALSCLPFSLETSVFSSVVENFANLNVVCKTWSLILREEHRMRMFENRVLRRIFGQKRDEMMGRGWRKLYNKKISDLYSSSSLISIINFWGG
jgi:hypothetical protein